MNRRQLIALLIGGLLIVTAVVMRPIEKRTTVKLNGLDMVTYRDIARISPLWDWWITRHDSLSFSRFPHSFESPGSKTKEDYDLNWRMYLLFIGLPTIGTAFALFRLRSTVTVHSASATEKMS